MFDSKFLRIWWIILGWGRLNRKLLGDNRDIVDNLSILNVIYSTAFIENKKKRKDIAEDGLQSTKEESKRNVCINFVCVSGK